MAGVIVEVSARKFAVPFECVCCGAAPDTEMTVSATRTAGVRVVRETTRGLDFPYCRRCVAHVAAWESAGVYSSAAMVVGILAGAIVAAAARLWIGALVVVAAVPLALVLASLRRAAARSACGPACAAPGKAVAYLGWSGTVSAFAFESPTYTARFAEQNASKLVNASAALRRLLEGHRVARLAVPTPAAAVSVVTAPPTVLEWIAKIEDLRGPVARRNALERALEVIHDPRERGELVLAASRIEVAAVLDKVDGLTSRSAKRRHLQRAIEDLRADNIPDELQEAELRELEARLRELG